jgi:hypothetical protein
MAVESLSELLKDGAFLAASSGVAIALWARRSFVRAMAILFLVAVLLETIVILLAGLRSLAEVQGTVAATVLLALALLWRLRGFIPGGPSRAFERERAKVVECWDLVAQKLTKRPTAVFSFGAPSEIVAARLADALSGAGFESPRHTATRHWLRRTWTVAAAKRVARPFDLDSVTSLLRHAVELAETHGARFDGWAAVDAWP